MKVLLDEENRTMIDGSNALPFALENNVAGETYAGVSIPLPAETFCPAYNDLDESYIRLLKVLPGDFADEVCCLLMPIEIDSTLIYTALSYAWGSGPASCTIRLNGHRLLVRKNLWRFLRQVRAIKDDTSVLFWIDALCIDQSNNNERAHQVHLMPRIYAEADIVRVWLGPAYDDSGIAMQQLDNRSSSRRAKRNHLKLWSNRGGAAIRSLCFRKYWTRLWIFQELLLARRIEIMCGGDLVLWDRFCDLLREVNANLTPLIVHDKFYYQAVRSSAAMSIAMSVLEQTIVKPYRYQERLFRLLAATQHLGCVESRDRIYALLGIAGHGHEDLKPDYEIPVPALLNIVLRNQHRIERPRSTEEVRTQCKQLTAIFGLNDGAVFELVGKQGQLPDSKEKSAYPHPSRDQDRPITLWWTSFYGHKAVQDLLFEEGIISHSILASAAEDGDLATIKLVLDTDKMNINGGGNPYETVLHRAARRGHVSLVAFLLHTTEIDVNRKDFEGSTALHLAVKWRQAEVVDLLIKTGKVEIGSKDKLQHTPFSRAVVNGDEEVVRLLLGTGQVAVKEELLEWGLLHYTAMCGHEGVAKLLLDTGVADVGVTDGKGSRTPLHWAVVGGYEGIVKLMLDRSAFGLNVKGEHEQTALHMAAVRDHEGIVKLLLDTGAFDVNDTDLSGWTPLHHAAKMGKKALVKLLLDAQQVDVNARDGAGRTPLHEAARRGNKSVIKVLLDTGKADVGIEDDEGDTPLHTAALLGYEGVVKLLLDTGKVDAGSRNAFGETHLELARDNYYEGVVRLLRMHGIANGAISIDEPGDDDKENEVGGEAESEAESVTGDEVRDEVRDETGCGTEHGIESLHLLRNRPPSRARDRSDPKGSGNAPV